jgi:predicted Fe-S protein YdhL (DUF1289 family)
VLNALAGRATVVSPLFMSGLSPMGAKNPCIDVCKFDKKTGFCLGCLRTRDECKDWKKMKDGKRIRILDERKQREAKLAK